MFDLGLGRPQPPDEEQIHHPTLVSLATLGAGSVAVYERVHASHDLMITTT